MKSKILPLIIALAGFIVLSAGAQDLIQYPAQTIKLQMLEDGGRNGTAVVFNPEKDYYYCAMAGNADFPLETFSERGENLYQSRTYNDMRGMWWNPKEDALQGNCYSDGGIVEIGIDENVYAGAGNMILFSGKRQPGDHSCGTIDPKKKEILYYDDGIVKGYSTKDGEPTDTYLVLDLPVEKGDINYTTLVFTGEKKMELGLLDHYSKKVYLFNRKDGSLAATINLPSDAITYEAFNFAFANGHVFLFDQDDREWTGYKVFNE